MKTRKKRWELEQQCMTDSFKSIQSNGSLSPRHQLYIRTLALLAGDAVAGLFLPPKATPGGPGMAGAEGRTGAGPGRTGTAPANTGAFRRLRGGTRL